MYEGKCNCGENYFGETGRNVPLRWDEHSDIGKIQSQQNILINLLNTDLIGKLS